MSMKNKVTSEISIFVLILAVLFVALASLSVFLITGESRRARILVEYEADRIASGLLDAFRSQGSLEPEALDPRIMGFGLYRASGERALAFGDAPESIGPQDLAQAFRYDERRRSLSLTRPLGMAQGPGGQGLGKMQQRMARRIMGAAGVFYFSMGIADYYRSRLLYKIAAFLVPAMIAALAAGFLALLLSNLRFRRRALEQETLARLGESARTLAHEIRNPLGAIRLQTGLLRKRLSGEADRELDAIEEETERLNALTRRVGDFLRNPLGSPEDIDLPEFLGDLARRFPRPLALPGAMPAATVRFDRELLRSVIENLARNAHESYGEAALPAAGEVEIAVAREANRVLVSVLDRGAGIAEGLEGKVFDPFYTSKTQGSGIGLPLARRFVEAAGGSLSLLHRQGGGTEARIELPAGSPS